jgi:hypothetical protein
MASSAASDSLQIGKMLEVVAYLAGFCLVVAGFLQLRQASMQPGSPKAPAGWTILIGVFLLGVGAFASSVSGTFGGSGAETGLGKLGIGH